MFDEIWELLLHCREELGMASSTVVWTENGKKISPRIMLFYEQYRITIQLRLENVLINLDEYGYEQTVDYLDQEVETILLRYRRMRGD